METAMEPTDIRTELYHDITNNYTHHLLYIINNYPEKVTSDHVVHALDKFEEKEKEIIKALVNANDNILYNHYLLNFAKDKGKLGMLMNAYSGELDYQKLFTLLQKRYSIKKDFVGFFNDAKNYNDSKDPSLFENTNPEKFYKKALTLFIECIRHATKKDALTDSSHPELSDLLENPIHQNDDSENKELTGYTINDEGIE